MWIMSTSKYGSCIFRFVCVIEGLIFLDIKKEYFLSGTLGIQGGSMSNVYRQLYIGVINF
jgi:hypothetical protein